MDPLVGIAAAGGITSGISGIANFGLGLMNYNYQKKLQNKMFQREDTAIQRRVADLRAAGLSPVLAAGAGASAGPVVSTTAPQVDNLGLSDSAIAVMNLITQRKGIERTNADIARINKELEVMDTQKEKLASEIVGQKIKNAQIGQDWKIQKDLGVTSNITGDSGLAKDLYSILAKKRQAEKEKKELELKAKGNKKVIEYDKWGRPIN